MSVYDTWTTTDEARNAYASTMRGRHLRVMLQVAAIVGLAAFAAIPRTSTPASEAEKPGASIAVASMPAAGTPTATALSPTVLATLPPILSPSLLPSPSPPPPTATPAPSPSPSPSPSAPATFGFAAKGMTGEMMAFVTAPQLEYARDRLDIDVVSTIAYYGLTVTGDGTIDRSGSDWQRWTSTTMDAVIARAHAAGTRVVLSLARFSWTAADAAATDRLLGMTALRARLADDVAAEVIRRGVDGVNFDFVPIPTGRAADFTDLVRRVRADLARAGDGYQLTVDVSADVASWDVSGLVAAGAADAIYLIGYEYAGSWSTVAGSTAPYGGGQHDVEATIDALLRLVRPEQLIVGVSYAGHLWPTASSTVHARTTGPGSDVTYETAISEAGAHGLRFDPVEHTAWTAWQSPACAGCGLTWVQVYFDDARSLAWKWGEIRRRNLLGSGVWTIAWEGSPGKLDRAMREAFLVRPAG